MNSESFAPVTLASMDQLRFVSDQVAEVTVVLKRIWLYKSYFAAMSRRYF
jgi:hypothetical protein